MLSASRDAVWDPRGFSYALDNGAFTCWTRGEQWDAFRFMQLVEAYGPTSDFVVLPDAVKDADRTRALVGEWLPRLSWLPRVLVGAQDGMTPKDIPDGCGVFVGGGDDWKERSIPMWLEWKRATGGYVHVGRVNSIRRIAICTGVDSIDGTSASRFAKTVRKLDLASRQRGLWI